MKYTIAVLLIFLFACSRKSVEEKHPTSVVELVVLGNVQDAGSPQLACTKTCCTALSAAEKLKRMVSCLGLIDSENSESYLLDATPNIVDQLTLLNRLGELPAGQLPSAIFLTHAHIGHYTGLMQLGKEAYNAKSQPTYCMPNMMKFLSSNGPWDQLVEKRNIELFAMEEGEKIQLSSDLSIRPICVPHRDEYSETVGFFIYGPNKTALFIPDIDKWQAWSHSIIDLIRKVDYAFVDATFFDGDEIPGRDMSEIPHPFVIESMQLFDSLSTGDKAKVHFIHMNHSNPLLDETSEKTSQVLKKGFRIARLSDRYEL